MRVGSGRAPKGPCAKAVLAVFGSLFLIALLSVPVTTRSSELRQAAGSNIIVRTTYPRKATMFLPQVLAAKARRAGGRDVRIRSTQWTGSMVVVAVLGIFDYFVICRLVGRRRPTAEEP